MPVINDFVNQSCQLFVLQKILHQLQIPCTKPYLRQALARQPDGQNMLAIVQVLRHYRVKSLCIQVGSQQLTQITDPFVAHLHNMSGNFVYVTGIEGDTITYYDRYATGVQTKTMEAFSNDCSGVILLFEKTAASAEPRYRTNKLQAAAGQLLYAALLALAVLFLLQPLGSVHSFFCRLTALAGIVVSTLLLLQTHGIVNAAAEKICGISQRVNCASVVSGRYAKLFGCISWSALGLCYYIVQATLLWAAASVPAAAFLHPVLLAMSLGSLLYVPYSLYLQGVVIKSWCPLCLTVLSLLLVQGVLFVAGPWQPFMAGTAAAYTAAAMAALAAVLLTVGIVQLIHRQGQLIACRKAAIKFTANRDLFDYAAAQAKVIPHGLAQHAVWLGNPDAANSLTVVSNVLCGPCAHFHQQVRDFISYHQGDVTVRYYFTVADELAARITKIIIAAWQQLPAAQFIVFFDAYFEVHAHRRQKWVQQWQHLLVVTDTVQSVLDHHLVFCMEMEVQHTPTVYYNNRELPQQYSLEHLQWVG